MPETEIIITLSSYIDITTISPDSYDRRIRKNFTNQLTISDAIETLSCAKNTRNTNKLKNTIGEGNVVIVYSNFFYDVWEKIKIFTEDMGFYVLFCDSRGEKLPITNLSKKVIKSNIVDIFNFLKTRKKIFNVLYLSVNAVWRHVLPYLIRVAFPKVKIISYMYDWLSFFCPYKHKEYLQTYLNLPIENIESEYTIYNKILSGKITDGILYKDGGKNISSLTNYSLPKLYMPVFLPKRLQQKPPDHITNPTKFVYMGKLFSPSDHRPELFKDGYFFDIVKKMALQNYSTDLYFVRTSTKTLSYYKHHLKDCAQVNLIEGNPLDKLLPTIAGDYHWGYLINNYSDDYIIYADQVKIGLPSRLFAYLALNIPVVISKQLTYAAELVTKNGIGVAISLEDIPHLNTILKASNYKKFLKNIAVFRDKHSFEIHRTNFKNFINTIMC